MLLIKKLLNFGLVVLVLLIQNVNFVEQNLVDLDNLRQTHFEVRILFVHHEVNIYKVHQVCDLSFWSFQVVNE